jgi:sodium-dependent dicarboxylate transporter 2/3/5
MMNDAGRRAVIIDRRPILWIIAERGARFFALLLLFAALYAFIRREPWEGLSREGYRAIGSFCLCTALWLTQLIPPAITGLLAIAIIPILGILPSKEAYSYFGSDAVFFILGAFILAAAMMKSGLSRRLSMLLLRSSGKSPRRLVFRILVSTGLLSCLMSEHAVAAFFFPIVLEIARALEYEPSGGEYGKTLFLAMAWGCIIGGTVTLLGGARAPLAVGILREITGQGIGFFAWMKTTSCVALPLMAAAYFLLTRYFKTDVTSVHTVKAVMERKLREMGPVTVTESLISAVLCASILAWMFLGESYGMGNIAIIAVVALFAFNLVRWKDVEEYVNWGIVLMYAGAICLGRAVDSSGALSWISQRVLVVPESLSVSFGGETAFWLLALLTLAGIFLTEMFSNAAVVALMLPVSIRMATHLGASPASMAYGIAIASGLGFIMPMGTPAIAIAYSSGYLKVRDIALPGLILNLLGWLLFILTAKFVWPWIGMSL